MITVSFDEGLRESAARRHRNALLTLPAHFTIVPAAGDVIVAERTAGGAGTRRVVVGPGEPGDDLSLTADSVVDWDPAIADFLTEIAPWRADVLGMTVVGWSGSRDTQGSLAETAEEARRLAVAVLPWVAESTWTSVPGANATSSSADAGTGRVSVSAVTVAAPSRRFLLQTIGGKVTAKLEVAWGETAKPSQWSIAGPDGVRTSPARYSSAARELWLAVASRS